MIFRSPHPDVDIPETTVTRFALQRADELRERIALVDSGARYVITASQFPENVVAAVTGRPDEESGELPVAYIVENEPGGDEPMRRSNR